MKEERLQILQMVQDRKVSAEEALKLLEAMEAAKPQPHGPRAAHVRIKVLEGGKSKSFSIGVGLVTWVANLLETGSIRVGSQKIDQKAIVAAINAGATGRVFEMNEGDQRLEIWLDP